MTGFPLLNAENLTRRRPLVVYLHRYAPEDERIQFSGMEALLRRLLERYDVLYVGMKGHLPVDPELRKGLCILQVPGTVDRRNGADKLLKLGLYYLLFPRIRRQIAALRPDVLMCREPLPLIPGAMCKLGIPALVASVSDHWWAILLGWNPLGRRLARRLERRDIAKWNRARALIVANTEAEKNVMISHGADPALMRLINTTSPENEFFACDAADVRRKLGLGPELKVFATHGTIRPGKGYGQLVGWWKDLAAAHPDWRLLVIGGAGGEAWLRHKIRQSGIGTSVVMTGWLPTHADVNRHLNAADVLLALRRKSEDNEGIVPSVLYHNLMTGKPTVVTGLPGLAEIIRDRVDGFLFEPDSYESFKNALENVVEHPEEAARVGRSGIARVAECFDIDRCARLHVDAIEELLARARPTGPSAAAKA
ncbi:MAG: glycosyltransferase family 4 protein [Kiritimatiellia bacterium]